MSVQTFASPGTSLSRRLERNTKGRDLVVGDIHGHFATVRRALAELEVGDDDRVFSLGDLVDRGPGCWEAIDWIEGSVRPGFDLVLRGNYEEMMQEALDVPDYARWRKSSPWPWKLWAHNGRTWWHGRNATEETEARWTGALRRLLYCARIDTRHGPDGLVHASPVVARWEDLEAHVVGEEWPADLTRRKALWSRARHGWMQQDLLEDM